VVSVERCDSDSPDPTQDGEADGNGSPPRELVALGESSELSSWAVEVTDVNGNAWNALRRQNAPRDRPAHGKRLVMVTARLTNIVPG
jgi:hypothetical protein